MEESQYNMKNPSVKRIMQELKEMRRQPSDDMVAEPLQDNLFEWHFAVAGAPDSEFEGGIFHGRIILPHDYPFKPPTFMLLSPTGRFETNTKICLSISNYHPEHWQPSWSVRTALTALIAFMPTRPDGAIGSLDYPPDERRVLAASSRVAPPSYGTPARQALIADVHERMLRGARPLPPATLALLPMPLVEALRAMEASQCVAAAQGDVPAGAPGVAAPSPAPPSPSPSPSSTRPPPSPSPMPSPSMSSKENDDKGTNNTGKGKDQPPACNNGGQAGAAPVLMLGVGGNDASITRTPSPTVATGGMPRERATAVTSASMTAAKESAPRDSGGAPARSADSQLVPREAAAPPDNLDAAALSSPAPPEPAAGGGIATPVAAGISSLFQGQYPPTPSAKAAAPSPVPREPSPIPPSTHGPSLSLSQPAYDTPLANPSPSPPGSVGSSARSSNAAVAGASTAVASPPAEELNGCVSPNELRRRHNARVHGQGSVGAGAGSDGSAPLGDLAARDRDQTPLWGGVNLPGLSGWVAAEGLQGDSQFGAAPLQGDHPARVPTPARNNSSSESTFFLTSLAVILSTAIALLLIRKVVRLFS